MQHRALFLDRDGVINVDQGYVHSPENFEFIDGIFDVARTAYAQHYRLVVITNQSGIARGLYSELQFHLLTSWMCDQFALKGAPVAKVYFSPYHPTAGIGEYRRDDVSRKPRPGMILQAQHELNLNLEDSVLIGDKPADIQAGIAAGVGCNLLFSSADPGGSLNTAYRRITSLSEALVMLNSGQLKVVTS